MITTEKLIRFITSHPPFHVNPDEPLGRWFVEGQKIVDEYGKGTGTIDTAQTIIVNHDGLTEDTE